VKKCPNGLRQLSWTVCIYALTKKIVELFLKAFYTVHDGLVDHLFGPSKPQCPFAFAKRAKILGIMYSMQSTRKPLSLQKNCSNGQSKVS
jgi:hypothetical protein